MSAFGFRFFVFCGLIILFFSSVLNISCAKKIPPEAEINQAREAIERAEKAGAVELEEFKSAKRYLSEAEKDMGEKKYEQARTKAIVAKEFAELALKRWNEIQKREQEELEKEKERKVELVEAEPELKKPKLPVEIKGVRPEDIVGESTLGRGYILGNFKKVYFDFDSYALTEDAKDAIKHNAEIVKKILEENDNLSLLIEGHCDERGSNEYNLELGWRRAQAVKRYIVLLGLPENRIQTVSFGEEFPEESCPPPYCNDEEKWKKNRRAIFVITAPQ